VLKDVAKAYALSDAKIQFVSLVDKAANKKRFLIAKSEGGNASFQSFGRIVKADGESHFVTGIVHEPMVEDTQGEYMTADEITKAAHWFMKNAGDVDIQHCFKKAKNVEVVESYVAKSDFKIGDEDIKEGTWLMTVEISDEGIWKAIEKGDITGFSMGGTATVSSVDDDLEADEAEKTEKSSLFKKFAKAFGYEVVEKGKVADRYNVRSKSENFYTAFDSLRAALEINKINESTGEYAWDYTNDESTIRGALEEFNEIIVDLLAKDSIIKSLEKDAKEAGIKPVEKAGKSISAKNLETLNGIITSLTEFVTSVSPAEEPETKDESSSEDNEKKEDEEMKKSEIQAIVDEAIAKAMQPITNQIAEIAKGDVTDDASKGQEEDEASPDDVSKAIAEAVSKAVQPLADQVDAICKSRALPSNLNDVLNDVEKSEDEVHYLHGII
jgi:hypothetical protein